MPIKARPCAHCFAEATAAAAVLKDTTVLWWAWGLRRWASMISICLGTKSRSRTGIAYYKMPWFPEIPWHFPKWSWWFVWQVTEKGAVFQRGVPKWPSTILEKESKNLGILTNDYLWILESNWFTLAEWLLSTQNRPLRGSRILCLSISTTNSAPKSISSLKRLVKKG